MRDEKLSVWILGDQVLTQHPALAEATQTHSQDQVRVVLVESPERSRRLPYQHKKLALLFSAMRHYVAHLRQNQNSSPTLTKATTKPTAPAMPNPRTWPILPRIMDSIFV